MFTDGKAHNIDQNEQKILLMETVKELHEWIKMWTFINIYI